MPKNQLREPLTTRSEYWLEHAHVIVVAALTVLGAVLVGVFRWKLWSTLRRWWLGTVYERTDISLDRVEVIERKNDALLARDENLRKKLDEERLAILKKRAAVKLELEGKSRDEIVAALRDLGY